jgi:DNA-binding Lrp family transcriptional regulator
MSSSESTFVIAYDQSNSLRPERETRPLDRIDREIVAALSNNARLSNKELAARVGLAPSSCLERFRRLVRDGVLRGFHADVDPQAIGLLIEALVSVQLKQHTRRAFERFRDYLRTLPEVADAYHVAGSTDFLVHVRAPTTDHLRDFLLDAFTTRPEVGRIETSLVFEHLPGGAPIVSA